ncbi:hypothetical protein ES703_23892 [subsurface metagenome]
MRLFKTKKFSKKHLLIKNKSLKYLKKINKIEQFNSEINN